MFDTVLVANRGEIARRVLRTCRRLGVRTVAVYSDADAHQPHVREADEAIRLGPAPAEDSYLDVEAIVAAARRTGADAIHPGYGFLSENPVLPEACAAAGVTFVGPSAEVMALMGDKAAAKRRLEAAGVPVVPGVHDDDLDDAAVAAAAEQVGFPVLLKAVAGGGGTGMRIVRSREELQDSLDAARREAAGAFGDDRMIVERVVERPRHVEIQVLGDAHGNVIHVLERECSIQRRHQKVVEETPSPALDEKLRTEMGEAAVTAAGEVAYTGAGTVEFLLSDITGDFYFLEMNTRLQVEHPVTEAVTGIDLVEEQLRIAAGERLRIAQDDVVGHGHALEVRLYAEDAAAGHLPQTGRVLVADFPDGHGVRVDSGVTAGSDVPRFYDPLLAKLITHADDRAGAIERMQWLLTHTAVLGVVTNIEFLADVVGHDAFAAGDLTTSFLDDHLAGWEVDEPSAEVLAAAAVALVRHDGTGPAGRGVDDPASPWRALGPWRTGGVGGWELTLRHRGDEHRLTVREVRGAVTVVIDGAAHDVAVRGIGDDGTMHVDVAGHGIPARVAVDGEVVWVHAGGATRRLVVEPATHHVTAGATAGGAAFTSPMPGAVLEVAVTDGEHVAAGATLVVVEAMKMEHPVVAPSDGTVTAVHVAEGDGVDAEQPLLEFEPDTQEED